jgi:predicted amidophosphoribosyltransferase
MEKEDFAHLLFRIEEMLVDVDYWRRQISECKECQGWSEKDYRNMCPACLRALNKEFETLKEVAGNEDMRALLKDLKKALKDDKSGELTEIFRLAKRTTFN